MVFIYGVMTGNSFLTFKYLGGLGGGGDTRGVSGWADGDFGSGNEADFEKKAIVRGLMAAKRSGVCR